MLGKGKSAGEGWEAQMPQRSALARSTAALQQFQKDLFSQFGNDGCW